MAAQLAADVSAALGRLAEEADGPERTAVSEQLDQLLKRMKLLIYGEQGSEPDPAAADELRLAMLLPETECLSCMIIQHDQAAFESRKVIALMVSHMLRKHPPTASHVEARPHILDRLVEGYSNPEIALTCGGMLRECLQQEALCMQVAQSERLLSLLVDAVQIPNFDVATDAFSRFKEVLTVRNRSHKHTLSLSLSLSLSLYFARSR